MHDSIWGTEFPGIVMIDQPRSGNRFHDTFCSAADATTNVRSRSRKHDVFFWLGMAISATILLAPPAASAQLCKGNINEGCTNSGAVCSPVETGTGKTGHCTSAHLAKGEMECRCEGTPLPSGPVFDAGCSNRAAQGKFTCTIVQPNVTQHETEYPNVVFAPGDIVEMTADGCVQTGGLGSTWKRYVNPSGPNSDHLYHGMVRILTATQDSALVEIRTVIGRELSVTGTGVALPQLDLHLGYEDDNYSDNGYYSHDDGTENQCQNSIDGGPAWVVVTIYRGVSPDAPSSTFDFDVLSTSLDSNGLFYNPSWSWQQQPGNQGQIPATSLCHNFSKRDSTLDVPNMFMSPDFSDCTDQADASTVDLPIEINAELCNWGSVPYFGSTFAGHVNWFPVTLEGHAYWGDHSGAPFPFGDDDYTFTFLNENPGNPLSANGRPGLHVEFDSDETIDHFSSDEWTAFHNAVDNNGNASQLFDGHTILTGMFGMDGEHDLKAELHPLYAIATLRDNFENAQSDEAWFMFVRNQGDEGYCSSQIWDSGFEDYTVRLPWRPGMTGVTVNWDKTQFVGTDGTSGPTLSALAPPSPDAGVYVTFHLGPAVSSSGIGTPASIPFINGALHLVWTGQPVATTAAGRITAPVASLLGSTATSTAAAGGTTAPETDEVEQAIQTAMSHLTPAQRQDVVKARAIAVTNPAPVHRLASTGAVQQLSKMPVLDKARIPARHAIKGGPAARKLARDAAQMRALCAATNNAPAGMPATICSTRTTTTTTIITNHP